MFVEKLKQLFNDGNMEGMMDCRALSTDPLLDNDTDERKLENVLFNYKLSGIYINLKVVVFFSKCIAIKLCVFYNVYIIFCAF